MKLSLQTAIIISILVSFVVDLITTRGVKDSIGRTKAVYEGMGKVFTSTVALICCAELFAFGMTEGEENFVGDSEIIALGGASNETKDRPLG